VTFLPYLQGERTPHRDASLRGALVGLSLAHTRAHLTRAVLEGVCFAMRDSLEILRELGLRPAELLLTGGGARSPFLRRLQADVYGVPVRTADREEGPAYGAALLASWARGATPTSPPPPAATRASGAAERPDPATRAAYDAAYARFRALAHAARPASAPAGGRGPDVTAGTGAGRVRRRTPRYTLACAAACALAAGRASRAAAQSAPPSDSAEADPVPVVRHNQVGYFARGPKVAVVPDQLAGDGRFVVRPARGGAPVLAGAWARRADGTRRASWYARPTSRA
jgi:hypothetical protein